MLVSETMGEVSVLRAGTDRIPGSEKHHVHLVDRTPTQEETMKRQVPPNVVGKTHG